MLLALRRRFATLLGLSMLASACGGDGPALSKRDKGAFEVHGRAPDSDEASAVGAITAPIGRGTPRFAHLVQCRHETIVFKDEELTGADRFMTPRLCQKLARLGARVRNEWPGLDLRVTEAWDEDHEHGAASLHYEGRAADVTTSDLDPAKLGRLARLAVDAELDWVYFENEKHVHVSVRR